MNNSKSTKAAGIKKNLMETYSLVLVLMVLGVILSVTTWRAVRLLSSR